MRTETNERESLALTAAQLREDMSLLRGGVPAQVSALSDARTAAETQALKLRQSLAAAQQGLADRDTKLDRLSEQHRDSESRRESDRKAWSVDRARLEG